MRSKRTWITLGLALLAMAGTQAALAQPTSQAAPEPQETAADTTPESATSEATEAANLPPAGGVSSAPSDAPAAASEPAANESQGAIASTAEAVTTGTEEVLDQGRAAWQDLVMPMWERFLVALPTALKAFGLLLLFWIGALILSRSVYWVLNKTDLDQRLVRDWGLSGLFEGGGRTVESTLATFVKWLVLLFGFVAFFNTLQLDLVAGPLQSMLSKITDAVPALLKAAVILLLYWAVGSVLRLAVTKALGAVKFDERAGRFIKPREVKGETLGASGQIGRLVFYVVLLFGLPPFLDALGQEAIVVPLRDMIGKVMAFFPNLVAALILLLIGKIVATIVREIVSNFLAATPLDGFAERYGFGAAQGGNRLSDIVGSVAFFFTFIPIVVAAVDSLRIEALSGPVKGTLEEVMRAIPLIFVALIILGIGYFIAKAVRGLLETFLQGVGFDALPGKVGLSFLQPKEGQASLSSIAGTVVMAIILLLTANQALATLGFLELAEMVGALIAYLPSLVVGLAIILAALSLGSYVAGLVQSMMAASGHAGLVANIARYAIIFLGFSMGLDQLGVSEEIVRLAVGAVLGGAALALGIAFGLGGRDRAKELLDEKLSSD